MAVSLNHTIVAAQDKEKAALFLTEILGLPAPSLLGPFAGVTVGDTSLDYMDTDDEIVSQHYAFLVCEIEFDQIFARIRERRLTYWADPYRQERDQINGWDDGRGLYFEGPERSPAGDHHPPVRQRWYSSVATSPVGCAEPGTGRSTSRLWASRKDWRRQARHCGATRSAGRVASR